MENKLLKYSQIGITVQFAGILTLDTASFFIDSLRKILERHQDEELVLDLEKISEIDSAGVQAVYFLQEYGIKKELTIKLTGLNAQIEEKFDLFRLKEIEEEKQKVRPGFFERVGAKSYEFIQEYFLDFLQHSADVFYWSFNDLFKKKTRRKNEVLNAAVHIGVNAIYIVAAMAFIIGLVLALQSSSQLRSLGANVYIVDLTVVAMMSEMGPLITAIMVAGRSGSSIAAEIATMKVTSETDALKTMGLSPYRFIVVPKMYGSVLTMPFLTIIADVMGIIGGFLIAVTALNISPAVFLSRMGVTLLFKDIVFGIIKSLVFAMIIVITGSYFGFKAERGAESVGRVTTTAVVTSIALVIVADMIMGLLFY